MHKLIYFAGKENGKNVRYLGSKSSKNSKGGWILETPENNIVDNEW